MKVLITASGSTTAISVAKALNLSSIYKFILIGTDIYDNFTIPSSIFFKKIYKVPRYFENNYIQTLTKICINENIQFIIPILDQEIEKITKNIDVFKKNNIIVCSSSYDTIVNCNDKYATYLKLKKKGINVSKVYLSKDLNKVKKFIKPPYFIKPRRGVSSIDCYKVDSFKELEILIKKINEPIIQKTLTGKKYVLDVLNDLNGKNIIVVPREEIDSKAGIGIKSISLNDKDLIRYGKKISEALKIIGPANIEIFREKGCIELIEINPRFSAGTIATVIAGVNTPEILIDIFLHKKINKKRFKWNSNLYMTRYWQEVFYLNKKIVK